MKHAWRTAWQGQDIVVYRDELEFDRFSADQIKRVMFTHRGSGESPGELELAVVELADEYLVFPSDTGFSGRVNFERQAYWAQRGCVYWVAESRATLPIRLRRGPRFLGFGPAGYARMPKADLASSVERWPLEGPQTWEQRKWRRIERSRPFGPRDRDDSQLRA